MSRIRRRPLLSALVLTPLLLVPSAQGQQKAATRPAWMENTPAAARPMVRWWWFGPAVTRPELLHELQQMKADGIGGAELAFVYPEELDDPARHIRNLPFVSPEMLDMVHYAETEGRKLGLRIDVTLCSGWPYGGPHITLDLAAGRLRAYEVPIPAGATSVARPAVGEGETFISASVAAGKPRQWDVRTAHALPGSTGSTLTVSPEPHDRVALFFYAGHTRQMVKRAAVGAEGFVLDPFSRQAVDAHLKAVGDPLLSAFGSTPPYAIFSDSLEAYGADWTPSLPAEFLKRRGYDLLPHLPEFVAGGTPAAEKVRHDVGITLTELINENYLVRITDWAKAHRTRFRSQTYGEPAVSFSSQRLVSLAEGEGPQWRAFSTLRWATSANHVFGNNVTSGETFTWLHSPVFRATPLDMKAEADIDFLMGENQLIFHGWPYSPPPSELKPGDPGWSLYAAAVFNDHNPWHPVMPAVTQYIARVSAALREGQPANQIALLLPTDDAWSGFSPGKVTVTGALKTLIQPDLMDALLAAGYNVDFIDADAINTVGLGTHTILLLPPTDRIPPATVAKIAAWTHTGGKVLTVGRKPTRDPEGAPLPQAWDSALPGAAHAANVASLREALHTLSPPDFVVDGDESLHHTLGFIRRKSATSDIYFVANTANTPAHATAHFTSGFFAGEEIDPDSRASTQVLAGKVDLDLAPYESRLFVFDKQGPPVHVAATHAQPVLDLSTGWTMNFTGSGKTMQAQALPDWTADPTTLHYSGEVRYTRTVHVSAPAAGHRTLLAIDGGKPLPGDPNSPWHGDEQRVLGPDGLPNPLVTGTGPGMHAYYDPPLHEAALVFVNGKPAGALWHPPYRLDITSLLHTGDNTLELRVFNTALNAWSGIPPRDYGPLKAKYGDRFQMQDLDKVKPVASGILGSIKLVTEAAQ